MAASRLNRIGSADEAPQSERPRCRLHWGIRLLRTVAVLYLLLIAVMPLIKRPMVYPGSLLPPDMVEFRPPQGTEVFRLTLADGTRLQGLFCAPLSSAESVARLAPDLKPPTILYFYGNASTVAHSMYEVELFRRTGANVLLVDYPGFGRSEGSPSEASLRETALALWDHALTYEQVDPRQIITVGWSLGGAVAADLASLRPAAGLVTVCAFTSLADMGREVMPIFPTRLTAGGEFDNIAKFQSLTVPVAILHSTRDQVVPFEMSRRLQAAAAKAPVVRYIPIPQATHDDPFYMGYDLVRMALIEQITMAQSAIRARQEPLGASRMRE